MLGLLHLKISTWIMIRGFKYIPVSRFNDGLQVLFNASKVKVNFDESAVDGSEIKSTIEKLGFYVLGEK